MRGAAPFVLLVCVAVFVNSWLSGDASATLVNSQAISNVVFCKVAGADGGVTPIRCLQPDGGTMGATAQYVENNNSAWHVYVGYTGMTVANSTRFGAKRGPTAKGGNIYSADVLRGTLGCVGETGADGGVEVTIQCAR